MWCECRSGSLSPSAAGMILVGLVVAVRGTTILPFTVREKRVASKSAL